MRKVKCDEPEGFSEFWAIWLPIKRRNDGRGDARDGFAKKVKAGHDPRDIIDGARWYVRNLPPGYEYVPLAKTWINREVWADDCEKERAYQARLRERQNNVVQMEKPRPRDRTVFQQLWERQKSESA